MSKFKIGDMVRVKKSINATGFDNVLGKAGKIVDIRYFYEVMIRGQKYLMLESEIEPYIKPNKNPFKVGDHVISRKFRTKNVVASLGDLNNKNKDNAVTYTSGGWDYVEDLDLDPDFISKNPFKPGDRVVYVDPERDRNCVHTVKCLGDYLERNIDKAVTYEGGGWDYVSSLKLDEPEVKKLSDKRWFVIAIDELLGVNLDFTHFVSYKTKEEAEKAALTSQKDEPGVVYVVAEMVSRVKTETTTVTKIESVA